MSSATYFNPPAVVLTNNGVSPLFDSTYSFCTAPSPTVVGPFRGRRINVRISGVVTSTTQNVTIRLDYLDASGSWVTGATTSAVTAGTPTPFDYLPIAADWRVVILNGATGPSALTAYGLKLINGDRASGS